MKLINAKVLIIGSGSAGMTAYKTASQLTDGVYLVEDHHFGTTCARVGCMPSKLLIAAANTRYHALHTDPFGIHVNGEVLVNGKEVMARVKSERDRFVGFVLDDVAEFPDESKILGKARFINQYQVQVDEHTLITAERIVIATGSRPKLEARFTHLKDKLIVNDDIFNWDTLPKSVAILATGIIGLELGQALHRLGVAVTIFARANSIGSISDPVVAEHARNILSEELNIKFNTHVEVQLEDDSVRIDFIENKQQQQLKVDYLVSVIGRIPNTDNLGLDNIEIQLDKNGAPIANRLTMQTSIPHIFIAGDASDEVQLLHEAIDQGKIAGQNAASYPEITTGLRRSFLGIIFTEPEIAAVGHRWKELHNNHDDFVTGEVSFVNQGRSRIMLINKGYLRLYADKKTGRLLGSEMIAPAGEHLAHLLAWAHQQKLTIDQILELPFYHPVIEEGLKTALRDAKSKLQ